MRLERPRVVFLSLGLAACLSVALPLAAQRAPNTLAEIAAGAGAAAAAKNWPAAEAGYREAAEIARKRAEVSPDNADLANARHAYTYNAACAAAQQAHLDAAFELLDALVDARWYDNAGLLQADADLEPLRADTARFAALVARKQSVLAAAAEGHAEGKILLPIKGAPKRGLMPGIVALHGGGGNIEELDSAWQGVADQTGALIILVRGVVVQDIGAFSYDQRDPSRDVARIESWIAKAKAEQPALDEGDLFLSGFSQGGGMAWLVGIRGERTWRGVIPVGGYVQVAARETVMGEPRHAVAAFAIIGEKDEPAIREVNEKLVAQTGLTHLRACLEAIPGAGHGLPADLPRWMLRAMQWCRK